ncbi:transcriptional regulator [Wenjunlia vitaminophila]|uniref:Transcriptional regulator n=1 Tax=Wenjunlia vitaminophila TaxID=76728 RepID=A0A0T6LUU3_WENVI|nr:ROK family transcriptional regulator [Wenjunlia vitaminophila]KRV49792.1 transcriptional regulator [Wenjunlia vitaminophila]
MGQLTGGDPSLLRRINSAVVLRALRGTRHSSLTELVGMTGLSRPTVEGAVDGLVEAGLVVEVEPEPQDNRRQGRPARRYRFHAESGHLLGVEVGVHRVHTLLSDLSGRLLGSHTRQVAESASAEDRLGLLDQVVTELLQRAGVARDTLRAVGVGTPGIVEANGTVRLCTALPGWTELPLGERLRGAFPCPVLVENDANLAAVAERWKGAAAGSDDLVFVLAGLSPGAGSLINGRIHRGHGGAAGEIGALHLLGLGATPERLLSTTGQPLHPLDENAVTEVFRLAREGDPVAGSAVDRFVGRLVQDVGALVVALDPEVVVVGGWAAGLDDVLEPLRTRLARCCLRPPRVELSALGDAAITTGALRLALDHVEERFSAVGAAAP